MAKLLHDCIAGVHATEHSSQVLSIICTPTSTAIYSVPWIPVVMICSCAYVTCAAARDLCEFVTDTTVTPIEVTAHFIHFPLLCFIYVFICFVHVQPAVLGGGGVGKLSYSVFTAQSNSVYFAHNIHNTRFRVIYVITCYTDDIPPLVGNEQTVTVFILNLLFEFSDML